MLTFSEIRSYVEQNYDVVFDEKFVLGLELPAGDSERRQGIFLAEIKSPDDRRFLRLETTVAPLADHDPVKVLRVNLMLRIGYLAVGDMEGIPFLKLCHNLTYRNLDADLLDYYIRHFASLGDGMEETLTHGKDYF
ncbi:MAG: hypothetical protein RQ741_07930 [Wenzhouxiangellaceae bacterium]|nr:hypothetical protein [Wenzhouxiangellaceae bacterium]